MKRNVLVPAHRELGISARLLFLWLMQTLPFANTSILTIKMGADVWLPNECER